VIIKNVVWKIIFSLLILLSLFFCNMNEINAEPSLIPSQNADGSVKDPILAQRNSCSCYYTGEYVEDLRVTYYAVEMAYGSNFANVVSICETDERKNTYYGGNCKKAANPTRGNPFNVDSKYIYDNGCSLDACNSANIYFYSSILSTNNRTVWDIWSYSKEIVTSGYKCDLGVCVATPLKAYSKAQYDSVVNASNMQEAMVEEGMVENHFVYNNNDIKGIQCWANPNLQGCSNSASNKCQILDGKYYGKNGNVVDEKTYSQECYSGGCDVISAELLDLLQKLLFIIQIAGIVLLIILSAVEFIKAITGSDEDSLIKAVKNTVKRIIVVVILLLLPTLIIAILNFANSQQYQKDGNGNYIFGEDGNPLCNLEK